MAIARLFFQHLNPSTGKSLLEDVSARDRLLRRAANAELQDIILLLVAHGPNPNIWNEHHETLLHQAAEKGDRKMVQQLLVYEKTSVDARDNHGRTSLHIAAEYGHKSITGLLLNCHAVDINGATALCLAFQKRHTKIAQRILTE